MRMIAIRIFTVTAVCLLVLGIISGTGSVAQPQVKYNFTGSNFTTPPARARSRPVARPMATGAVRGGYRSSYSGKRTVGFARPLAPGTILIKTGERRLYYVLKGGKAIQYGVGVGREGFTWKGRERISRKAEWPGWSPPRRMIARERAKGIILPAYMPGDRKSVV